MFADAFRLIQSIPPILTSTDEVKFLGALEILVQNHAIVPSLLASACQECSDLVSSEVLAAFITNILRLRIGIRMLLEHHIACHSPIDGYDGVICHRVSPMKMLRLTEDIVAPMCIAKYGRCPGVVVNGDVDATFVFVSAHVEYILQVRWVLLFINYN